MKRAVEEDLENGDGTLTRRCVNEGAVDSEWLKRKVKALSRKSNA